MNETRAVQGDRRRNEPGKRDSPGSPVQPRSVVRHRGSLDAQLDTRRGSLPCNTRRIRQRQDLPKGARPGLPCPARRTAPVPGGGDGTSDLDPERPALRHNPHGRRARAARGDVAAHSASVRPGAGRPPRGTTRSRTEGAAPEPARGRNRHRRRDRPRRRRTQHLHLPGPPGERAGNRSRTPEEQHDEARSGDSAASAGQHVQPGSGDAGGPDSAGRADPVAGNPGQDRIRARRLRTSGVERSRHRHPPPGRGAGLHGLRTKTDRIRGSGRRARPRAHRRARGGPGTAGRPGSARPRSARWPRTTPT